MSASEHSPQAHPYQQGFTAFRPGVDLSMITLAEVCPYRAGTESCAQWIAGYFTAANALNYNTGEPNETL